ncbi:MAG: hypothetical protein EBT09_04810 [Actinobacteria bacterium]|nr:hypothetical protein [Actinomycetota bacterium]
MDHQRGRVVRGVTGPCAHHGRVSPGLSGELGNARMVAAWNTQSCGCFSQIPHGLPAFRRIPTREPMF